MKLLSFKPDRDAGEHVPLSMRKGLLIGAGLGIWAFGSTLLEEQVKTLVLRKTVTGKFAPVKNRSSDPMLLVRDNAATIPERARITARHVIYP